LGQSETAEEIQGIHQNAGQHNLSGSRNTHQMWHREVPGNTKSEDLSMNTRGICKKCVFFGDLLLIWDPDSQTKHFVCSQCTSVNVVLHVDSKTEGIEQLGNRFGEMILDEIGKIPPEAFQSIRESLRIQAEKHRCEKVTVETTEPGEREWQEYMSREIRPYWNNPELVLPESGKWVLLKGLVCEEIIQQWIKEGTPALHNPGIGEAKYVIGAGWQDMFGGPVPIEDFSIFWWGEIPE